MPAACRHCSVPEDGAGSEREQSHYHGVHSSQGDQQDKAVNQEACSATGAGQGEGGDREEGSEQVFARPHRKFGMLT